MSEVWRRLRQALAHGLIRHVDYYLARHLQAIDGVDDDRLAMLASLTSASLGQGHACIELASLAGSELVSPQDGSLLLAVPPLDELLHTLERSQVVGRPGEQAPLIADEQGRLYLGRYWWYERRVADCLRQRARQEPDEGLDRPRLQASLERIFDQAAGAVDWQKVAAAVAALRHFTVISGGPGTGKTYTVTGILALLLEQHEQPAKLRIALTAPTGKAAARLTESIRQAKPVIPCDESIRDLIPEQASTIHRLIGVRPGRSRPAYHAENPLAIDVLVVDEASMIDLPLMAALLDALPASARIIMLGDKDQLASVEAGSVFADISGGEAVSGFSESLSRELAALAGVTLPPRQQVSLLADCVVQLQRSYRFGDASGIGNLARAVNAGDAAAVQAILASELQDVAWRPVDEQQLANAVDRWVLPVYARCFESATVDQAIAEFERFRVLCALRKTPFGVEHINALVEDRLRRQGLIHVDGQFYPGRPILVTRNDYSLGLFNGDIGILWPDSRSNDDLRAWFRRPDNSMLKVSPSRLPQHETAYAMTVHKAQGSEFEQVLILLPDEHNPLLTRELLYTAVTRARSQVTVWGRQLTIALCVEAQVKRSSGLADKIHQPVPAK